MLSETFTNLILLTTFLIVLVERFTRLIKFLVVLSRTFVILEKFIDVSFEAFFPCNTVHERLNIVK